MTSTTLQKYFPKDKKQIALLIDPDKQTAASLSSLLTKALKAGIDSIFVGGSLLTEPIEPTVELCKQQTDLPVLLFPGASHQLTPKADAILFLSLVSGRNPEFLIGQQVQAAPFLQKSNLDILPTAYILVDGGKVTSVEYISNTRPIPADKTDIAAATALAAKYMGMQCVYLEAGSGAKYHVPLEMISTVKRNTNMPLIVGGGIRTLDAAKAIFEAGADTIVLGSVAEQNPDTFVQICSLKQI